LPSIRPSALRCPPPFATPLCCPTKKAALGAELVGFAARGRVHHRAREFLPGGEMLEVLDPAASLLLELLHAAALAALAACAPEPTAGWACADLVSRLGAPLADLEALVAAVVAAGGGGALPALFELPRAACQALAACAPEPTAGWACADLVSRLGAPLADLEALVAAVVAAGGGGALPALFELPRRRSRPSRPRRARACASRPSL
jgi:hypothetical protein